MQGQEFISAFICVADSQRQAGALLAGAMELGSAFPMAQCSQSIEYAAVSLGCLGLFFC